MYREDTLHQAWRQVRATVPPDCLAFSRRYGSAGWLRLFAQDIVKDEEVHALIWVDAGDYIFLQDPSRLLDHYSTAYTFWAPGSATSWGALPLQVFNMRQMRRRSWREMVLKAVREGYSVHGAEFCSLGEGRTMYQLRAGSEGVLWQSLPSTWAYEPWAAWLPGYGTVNVWSKIRAIKWLLQAGGAVWEKAFFPGLVDFTSVSVRCLPLVEAVTSHILSVERGALTISDGDADMMMHYRRQSRANATFEDGISQRVQCDERVQGLHLPSPYHFVPWAHRFLNFWAGQPVWEANTHEAHRDLRHQ
ncbi:unnamed protein product [Prorocentrum cordatum]|uniref:Protein xylosyltransferase n=1 Tax=Prorocentrum cordatum TaxID=2364126 RepID=A0ABN9PR56_9DINO|nr:unnamed protein product [Polarella glacialis]